MLCRGCQQVLNVLKFIEGNDFEIALRNRQAIDRNAAGDKDLIVKNAVSYPMIRSNIASNKFKFLRGYIKADLFLNLTHDTVQKAFVTFAAATEKV